MTRDVKRDAEMYDKHSVKSFNPLNPCLIAGKRDSEISNQQFSAKLRLYLLSSHL